MACEKCDYKGYIELSHMINADEEGKPKVSVCHDCNDTKAYSEYVKNIYGGQEETKQERINRLLGRD